MYKRRFAVLLALAGGCSAVLIGAAAPTAPAAPHYAVRVIDEPEGKAFPSPSRIEALNNRGDVLLWVGFKDRTQRARLWRRGRLIDLGTLGGKDTIPRGLNDRGQAVGSSLTTSGEFHAFVWEDGEMEELQTPAGLHSEAWGINNAGDVVGSTEDPTTRERHAVLWRDRTLRRLPDFGYYSGAIHINDYGQIAGSGQATRGGYGHAFLWQKGQVRGLGVFAGYGTSHIWDMNARGHAVGFVSRGGSVHTVGEHRPFFYSDGKMRELPALEAASLIPHSINASGDILAGRGKAPLVDQQIYLYRRGQLWNLDDLVRGSGWNIRAVGQINDRGQITAYGKRGAEERGLLLTPVEP